MMTSLYSGRSIPFNSVHFSIDTFLGKSIIIPKGRSAIIDFINKKIQ